MRWPIRTTALLAGLVVVLGSPAVRATTGTLNVQLEITADCQMTATSLLDFGSTGVLIDDIDDSADLSIVCSEGVSYDIGLDAGLNATPATDVNDRNLENSGDLIGYQLYKTNAYAEVWGNDGAAVVSSTGTGSAQTFTVWGRVPAQATPPAGTYQDTVTVTMSF